MLYTVLGLYDPAELAIDTRLVACIHWNDEPLIPSHHGFARPRELFGAQPDASTRERFRTSSARHPLLTLVCVLRIAGCA